MKANAVIDSSKARARSVPGKTGSIVHKSNLSNREILQRTETLLEAFSTFLRLVAQHSEISKAYGEALGRAPCVSYNQILDGLDYTESSDYYESNNLRIEKEQALRRFQTNMRALKELLSRMGFKDADMCLSENSNPWYFDGNHSEGIKIIFPMRLFNEISELLKRSPQTSNNELYCFIRAVEKDARDSEITKKCKRDLTNACLRIVGFTTP